MNREKQCFSAADRQVTLYRSAVADQPLIVLNTYSGDGSSVIEAMEEIGAPDCNFLVVGELKWDRDMTPWYCPPLTENDTPYTGGAAEYLEVLLSEILPRAKKNIDGTPAFVGIAGYSLAGLFALYAMYRCDAFDRAASISGSLWFPDFREYATEREMMKRPEKLYISLGDKEANTRNQYLKTVRRNTETLVKHYKRLGLDVTWELTPGSHFKNPALRSAKGIKAILEQEK